MKRLMVSTALVGLATTVVSAQGYLPKGAVEGWGIFYNEATGGCFMESQQGPYVVQLGTEAALLGEGDNEKFGFLAVYTFDVAPAVQDGVLDAVVFDIDGIRVAGPATGVVRDGYVGGYVVTNDPAFGKALAQKQTLTINPDGPSPVAIDLTGSMKGMETVRACQAERIGMETRPDGGYVPVSWADSWQVFYNEKTAGCFMESAQGPYVVQIGTEAALLGEGEMEQFGFLAVYTTDLGPQVVDGELKDVVLEIDGEPWVHSRTGVVREGYVGGYVVSNDATFGEAFANKQTMVINPDQPGAVSIDLTGTMKAMDATRACQAEMGAQ